MKKVATTFIAMFMMTLLSGQHEIGIRVGGSFNDTRVDGIIPELTPDTRFREGFTAGLYYNIPLMNGFSFAPGINYTQKGFVVDEGFDVDLLGMNIPLGVKVDTRLDFVEVPLLFRYNMPKGLANFYLEGGPTVGYALEGVARTKARTIIDINVNTTHLDLSKDLYNRLELSGQVGAGVEVQAGSGMLFTNVRYQRGFSDMIDNPTIDISMKNSSFNFGVGYVFRFGGTDRKSPFGA
jgi:opacity protein-like surface antigen